MKNLKHIFSILAILIAVTLTSCNFNDNSEQNFTKYSVGKWLIGNWNFEYSLTQKATINGEPIDLDNFYETYSGTIEIKGIKDNSKVIISSEGKNFKMNFENFIKVLLGITEVSGTKVIESDISSVISANKKKLTIKVFILSSSQLMEYQKIMHLCHDFVMAKK